MSADALRDALAAGDVAQVRAVLEPLDAAERRALRPEARAGWKAHPMRWSVHHEPPFDVPQCVAAAHARFATEPWSELRKGNWVVWRGHQSAHGDWVRWALERLAPEWSARVPERLIELGAHDYAWQLVIDGLCPRPETDAWRLAMRFFGTRWVRPGELAERTDRDPQLVMDVYDGLHLFGKADHALAFKWEGGNAWGPALIEATRAGRIARTDLLQKGLARLAVDLARNQYVWVRDLVDAIAPSDAENDSAADAWLLVLRSSDPKTVQWALPFVDGLLARNTIGFERVAPMTEGWPSLASAGAVKKVLGWLVKRRELDGGATLVARAWHAVLHPKPPVSEHAATLLVAHGTDQRASFTTQWPEIRPLVGGGTQTILDEWLGAPAPAVPAEIETRSGPARERSEVPSLTDPEAVLDGWTRWLEHQDDARLLEQIIAGTVRVGDHAGEPAVQQSLQRVLKRVHALQGRRPTAWGPLAEVWAGGTLVAATWHGPGLDAIEERRVHEVAALLQAAPGAQVLSTPTHEGFVIAPAEAVRRVAAWPLDDEPVIEGQLLLLRLDRSGRADAREAASLLETPLGHALRHALGEAVAAPAPWTAAATVARDGEPTGWTETSWGYHSHQHMPEPHPRVVWTSSIADPPTHVLGGLAAERQGFFAHVDARGARAYRSYTPVETTSYWAYALGAVSALLKWQEQGIAHAALLEPLFDPWEPCPPAASAVLGAALGCLDDSVRLAATDLFALMVQDGRLDPEGVGRTIGRLTRSTPPNRWVRGLGDLVPDHPRPIADTLEHALETLPEPLPKGIAALLEVLDDALAAAGCGLRSDSARLALKRITRGGRTKTVVRRLLERA